MQRIRPGTRLGVFFPLLSLWAGGSGGRSCVHNDPSCVAGKPRKTGQPSFLLSPISLTLLQRVSYDPIKSADAGDLRANKVFILKSARSTLSKCPPTQ